MRKKGPLLLAGIVLMTLALYAWRRQQQKGADGTEARQTVQATLGNIEDTVEATGDILPLNRIEIKPPIAGRIEKLLVNEGDRVPAGAILGWMSSTDRAAILDAARAKGPEELRHWQDAYKPTPILAPLSGTVILRNVVVGQTVEVATVLYAMSDKLIVLANVDETDIGRVRIEMPAVITLDAYPNSPIQGRVFQIRSEGKNVSNVITYGVKIEPSNVPPFFRSQMTANISLAASKKEHVVLLPSAAIRPTTTGEKQVLIPGPNGKPVPRLVKTGLEKGDNVEIVEGVQAGDTVLMIGKRYTPQRAASTSPLIMGGPRRSGQGAAAGGQSPGGGQRR